MNVTGSKQYSKATSPMRRNINENQIDRKLVYIYPMLFANIVPQDLKLIFRSFLSKTFLREIFTSNYLDLVKMTNQITPFGGDTQSPNFAQLGYQMLGMNQQNLPNTSYFGGSQDKQELQQRLDENFKLVKQYLASDPIFKKLNPQVQIVTLDNFINVPVITGTAPLDLKMVPLIFLLMLALSTNTPLNSASNVTKLITKIKNTKKENLWQLLKKQKEYSAIQKIKMWAEDNPKVRQIAQKLNKIPLVNITPVNRTYEKLKTKFDEFDNEDYSFEIINQVQKDIDQVGLFFHLVLDKGQMESRYGHMSDKSLSSQVETRISPFQNQIFKNLEQNFLNLTSKSINVIFRSLSNLILPIRNQHINFHDVYKETIVNNLSEGIDKLIREVISKIINVEITQLNLSDNNSKFKTFKAMCSDIADDTKLISNIENKINSIEIKYSVKSGDQDAAKEITNYMVTMDKISSQLNSQVKKHYKKLNVLVGGQNIKIIQDQLESIVKKSTREFVYQYDKFADRDESVRTVNGLFNQNEGVKSEFIRKLKSNNEFWFNNIIEYLFLSSLSIALCELVNVIESEVDIVKHEVTDHPNYSLILPIEIIYALHAAYKARNLNDLFNNEDKNMASKREFVLTSTYTKGMIKYLTDRLKIPNLIVYDQKKGDIFYKFMNMTDVNNTKLNTIKTFNNLTIKSETHSAKSYY